MAHGRASSAGDLIDRHSQLDHGGPPFHSPPAAAGSDLDGRFRLHMMDQVSAQLIDMHARQHLVSRTPREIEATEEPSFLVYFQLAGNGKFRQQGTRGARLGPGDYVISSTHIPYTWELTGNFSIYTLRPAVPPCVRRARASGAPASPPPSSAAGH